MANDVGSITGVAQLQDIKDVLGGDGLEYIVMLAGVNRINKLDDAIREMANKINLNTEQADKSRAWIDKLESGDPRRPAAEERLAAANKTSSVDLLMMQALLAKYQAAVESTSNALKKLGDASQRVIGNFS